MALIPWAGSYSYDCDHVRCDPWSSAALPPHSAVRLCFTGQDPYQSNGEAAPRGNEA